MTSDWSYSTSNIFLWKMNLDDKNHQKKKKKIVEKVLFKMSTFFLPREEIFLEHCAYF